VFLQVPLLAELPVTDITLIRLFSGVNAHVTSEVGGLSKSLLAYLARVGFEAFVCTDVGAQAAALAEVLETYVALEGFLAVMLPGVLDEIDGGSEAPVAEGAGVHLLVCPVQPPVCFEIPLLGKGLVA